MGHLTGPARMAARRLRDRSPVRRLPSGSREATGVSARCATADRTATA
ncbi:hypothetical protein [Streptomyces tendae]